MNQLRDLMRWFCGFFLYLSSLFSILGGSFQQESLNEQSFYAVSSLKYHLQSFDEQNSEDEQIIFNKNDVASLWSIAAQNPSFANKVALAQNFYYESVTNNFGTASSKKDMGSAKKILEEVWEHSNCLLNGNEQASENKFDFFNATLKANANPFNDKEVKSFLLPINHPLYFTMQSLFKFNQGILENEETFINAGFEIISHQYHTFIYVAKHPLLAGYLVKGYLDSDQRKKNEIPGFKWLIDRCKGAQNIRKLIQKKKLKFFSVPDKWLFVIDPQINPNQSDKQNVILLVTDMQLVSDHDSRQAWKSVVTPAHLKELFCILSHGYSSCWLVHNIPYTKEGKFSCIDTEYPKRDLNYQKAKGFFSEEMGEYWERLVRSGGRSG